MATRYKVTLKQGGKTVGTLGPFAKKADAMREGEALAGMTNAKVYLEEVAAARKPSRRKNVSMAKTEGRAAETIWADKHGNSVVKLVKPDAKGKLRGAGYRVYLKSGQYYDFSRKAEAQRTYLALTSSPMETWNNPKKTTRRAKLTVKRPAYTRWDGTKVKATTYKTKDRGLKGRGPSTLPTAHPGVLGGPGYTARADFERHGILADVVKSQGYTTAMGALTLLQNYGKRTMAKSVLKIIASDKAWLKKHHGAKSGGAKGKHKSNPGGTTVVHGKAVRMGDIKRHFKPGDILDITAGKYGDNGFFGYWQWDGKALHAFDRNDPRVKHGTPWGKAFPGYQIKAAKLVGGSTALYAER